MDDEHPFGEEFAAKYDRTFSYNEVCGPFSCEVDGCGEECWTIVVSEEEVQKLEGDRFDKAMDVFRHNKGVAVCDDHLNEVLK
jgi:hypothetical protein